MVPNTQYPWPQWLKRQKPALELKKGRDYHCQPHSMAQQFRNAAHRHKKRVSIKIDGGTITVTIKGRAA